MKILAMVAATLLAGCSTLQQVPVEPVAISAPSPQPIMDEQCSSVAKYARAIAILRDINVPITDVNFILQRPVRLAADAFQQDIYFSQTSNPVDTEIMMYQRCISTTYDGILARYSQLQDTINTDLKKDIEATTDAIRATQSGQKYIMLSKLPTSDLILSTTLTIPK